MKKIIQSAASIIVLSFAVNISLQASNFFWLEYKSPEYIVTEIIDVSYELEEAAEISHQYLSINRKNMDLNKSFNEGEINKFLSNLQVRILKQPSFQIVDSVQSLTYPLPLTQFISDYEGYRATHAHSGTIEISPEGLGKQRLQFENTLQLSKREQIITTNSPIHLLFSIWHQILTQNSIGFETVSAIQNTFEFYDNLMGISTQYGIALMTDANQAFVGFAYFTSLDKPIVLLISERYLSIETNEEIEQMEVEPLPQQ